MREVWLTGWKFIAAFVVVMAIAVPVCIAGYLQARRERERG